MIGEHWGWQDELVATGDAPVQLISFLMDEAQLSRGIFESLRQCLTLREKYCSLGLQHKSDNPRDYPVMASCGFVAASDDGASPIPPCLPVRDVVLAGRLGSNFVACVLHDFRGDVPDIRQ